MSSVDVAKLSRGTSFSAEEIRKALKVLPLTESGMKSLLVNAASTNIEPTAFARMVRDIAGPEADWVSAFCRTPERDQRVAWLASAGGKEVRGVYAGVWIMDCGTYVYYEPVFWRPL